jgi:hypothetical protein
MESCLDQSLNTNIQHKYLYSKLFKYEQNVRTDMSCGPRITCGKGKCAGGHKARVGDIPTVLGKHILSQRQFRQ